MNLDEVKRRVSKYLGKKYHFIYKGARGQTEEFDGIITKMYSSTFLIELDDNRVKSFSYADFVIKNIIINF